MLFGASAIGKTAQIVRALYGMKSSGAAWRDIISTFLKYEMKFDMCQADNDIWHKVDTMSDGTKYYSYICIYMDDILVCSEFPKLYMDKIGEKFTLKKGSIGEPSVYLRADFRKKESIGGTPIWITGANSYVNKTIRIVDNILQSNGMKVSGSAKAPYSNTTYRPEFDISSFCDPNQIRIYQQLIGMLRWLVELGRIDVQLEVTQLSSFLAGQRIGHLHRAFHVFKYLKEHKNS